MNGTLQVGDSTVIGLPVVSSLQVTTSGGGAIQLGSNSLLNFDLFTGAGLGDNSGNANAADRLILLGLLDATLGGKLVIGNGGNPTPLTGFMQGDSWKLIDLSGGGSITGTLLLDYSALNLTPGLAASFDNGTGVLSITGAVPEPSRALLLMLGLMGVVGRRRRK